MNTHFFNTALFVFFFTLGTTNESRFACPDLAQLTHNVAQRLDTAPLIRCADLSEIGLLKEVEDAGYPFVVLTIEFPDRNFSERFTINLERAEGVDGQSLSEWVGRYVRFTYTSDVSNALLDIQLDGESLLGDDAPTLQPDVKQIMGKLRGANRETTGDEPGKITITTDDGTTETFSYFVTKELAAANGKVVIGYFEERTQNTIQSINVLPR